MMVLDYNSFLDNPEGTDLPFDIETALWWDLGNFVYAPIIVFLQYGLDIFWFFCFWYIVYVALFV